MVDHILLAPEEGHGPGVLRGPLRVRKDEAPIIDVADHLDRHVPGGACLVLGEVNGITDVLLLRAGEPDTDHRVPTHRIDLEFPRRQSHALPHETLRHEVVWPDHIREAVIANVAGLLLCVKHLPFKTKP